MFLITTLNYFNIISLKIVSIFKIIIPLLALFIGGFIMGKNAKKHGFLEGIKFSFIFILLFIVASLLLKEAIGTKDLLFYILILIASILGSMFGINTKKEA
jgi:putative membrane protein (TIGR04086 family)